ncbi:hypothetical protein [Streptomyces sp. NPDC056188]|uniref:hypothetical protein n=1 Tax=Streptomyces sp. NPDC056188 TaxID=3345740 RepID=UPI0035DFD30E
MTARRAADAGRTGAGAPTAAAAERRLPPAAGARQIRLTPGEAHPSAATNRPGQNT